MRAGLSARAVESTCSISGHPARGCSTLGRRERMRLPWPAARITTLSPPGMWKLSPKTSTYATGQVVGDGLALQRGEVQSRLGPPPQDVVRAHRPLACHQIVNLAGVEFGAEMRAEIAHGARFAEHFVGQR